MTDPNPNNKETDRQTKKETNLKSVTPLSHRDRTEVRRFGVKYRSSNGVRVSTFPEIQRHVRVTDEHNSIVQQSPTL